jgi:anaerobic dimethyl sulfoxide reductase subunit B (iron-sulfur subunit)
MTIGYQLERPAFHLDSQMCTGCKTCMVACKDKNDLPAGVRWRRVVEYSGGEWLPLDDGTFRQDVFAYYLSVSCNHCTEPICVEVCPTTAMIQDDSGIVRVDQDKCMGCKFCQWACPYDAPQFRKDTGRMSKCDFCYDEITTGGVPTCVAACPTRALTIGELDELRNNDGGGHVFAPLPDFSYTEPGAVFKPHRFSKPVNSLAGTIANPEENKDA